MTNILRDIFVGMVMFTIFIVLFYLPINPGFVSLALDNRVIGPNNSVVIPKNVGK